MVGLLLELLERFLGMAPHVARLGGDRLRGEQTKTAGKTHYNKRLPNCFPHCLSPSSAATATAPAPAATMATASEATGREVIGHTRYLMWRRRMDLIHCRR